MRLFDASHHDDAELLERHVLAQSDEVADTALQRFRFAHPMLILVTDNVLEIFRARLRGDPSETEQSLAAVKPRLGTRPDRQKHLRPRQSGLESGIRQWGAFKGHALRYTLVGTAAVVLTLLVGWSIVAPSHNAQMGVPVSAYVTGNGERAHITLPDGNTVALDVASRLEVPADYLTGNHALRLSGEALFTIQHHAGVPVTVLAGLTTTRVLGTSFVVRHYVTDTMTMVAVQEGKVAVGTAVVLADKLLEVRGNGTTEVRPATPAVFSFASGLLKLDDLNVSAAIPELDRWFDADIRLGDPSLAKRGMSGTCLPGTLADLSAILELTLNVRVVREGRVLTLFPR